MRNISSFIQLEDEIGANNYSPLPVVLVKGKGSRLWDENGKEYLDFMAAYSANNMGHAHPKLVKALTKQAKTLSLVSRAYYNDRLAGALEKLCHLSGMDKALPMNTGAEAVETAIKAARRWGYRVKGVAKDKAEIIVCENNFHGRTTTIVGFSSDPGTSGDYGPFTPGFKVVPFGDDKALEKAITKNTCAFIVEPIQGEAGIVMPPEGYFKKVEALCKKHNVMLIIDEIQAGMGRTGKTFCFQHEGIKPDGITVAKALGGGLMPVSAFVASAELMDVFDAGSHGSTWGGNPLAAAVASAAMDVLVDEKLVEKSAELGGYLMAGLKKINSPLITDIRGRGLWIGLDVNIDLIKAKKVTLALMENGVLTKETHAKTFRIAPPLVVTKKEIDKGLAIFEKTFRQLEKDLNL